MIQIFGILSGICMLIGGFFFILQIKRGASVPNLTNWLIVFLVSLINACTFYKIIHQNIYQSLVFFMSLLTTIVVFFYALNKGKFAKLTNFDLMVFGMAIFVGVLWKVSSDDRIANILVQMVIFIANSATIVGLVQKKLREYYVSWLWGISAYILAIIGFALSANHDWLAYFGPVMNGIISNGIIMSLSLKQQNN